MCNLVGIDKGALTMALNMLERAQKTEIADALKEQCVPVEVLLAQIAEKHPALYMSFVTMSMMRTYT